MYSTGVAEMQQGLFHAAEGQFREVERPLLDLNELLSLPDLTGMFWGAGLSKRIQVGTLPKGSYPTLVVAPALAKTTSHPKTTSGCESQPTNPDPITNLY